MVLVCAIAEMYALKHMQSSSLLHATEALVVCIARGVGLVVTYQYVW